MKKFLILTVLFVAFALPVSAEQPAAEQYRQMFASGNFYVECQMFGDAEIKWGFGRPKKAVSAKLIYAGKDGNRSFRSVATKNPKTTWAFNDLDLSKLYLGIDSSSRNVLNYSTASKDWPDVMYKDGKYYRFISSLKVQMYWLGKSLKAYVLPENELDSPALSEEQDWEYVKEDLTLPDEFCVFFPNDPMRDGFQTKPTPYFNVSSTRTVDGKEYDCDQYINDIKSLSNTVIAQEVYNVLYDGGKLVRIQKYLLRDGKEIHLYDNVILTLSGNAPAEAFSGTKKVKVYGARNGDMADLLEQEVVVETLGGK